VELNSLERKFRTKSKKEDADADALIYSKYSNT
jgi:hypothetical protein